MVSSFCKTSSTTAASVIGLIFLMNFPWEMIKTDLESVSLGTKVFWFELKILNYCNTWISMLFEFLFQHNFAHFSRQPAWVWDALFLLRGSRNQLDCRFTKDPNFSQETLKISYKLAVEYFFSGQIYLEDLQLQKSTQWRPVLSCWFSTPSFIIFWLSILIWSG